MVQSVSILIPTYNRADILKQTFDSLAALRIPPNVKTDLLVVVNACTDSTVDVCEEGFKKQSIPCRYVIEETPGLSVARNRAIAESTGEICAFLDDDIRLVPDWLEAMVEAFDSHPADIVGGKIDLWWSAVQPPPWFDNSHASLLGALDYSKEIVEIFPPKCAAGGNSAFRRPVFEKSGPYRTDLGRVGSGSMVACEDSDFFWRAQKDGARMFFAPRMVIEHWVAPQRATLDYLVRLARGNSKSRIITKQPYRLRQFLRSFVGHGYLAVRYEIERWLAKLRSDAPREVLCLLRRETGLAGMSAAIEHWRETRKSSTLSA